MATSVDPTAIPKRMSKEQLEWWILFGICVAGKGAKQTEAKLNALLEDMEWFGYTLKGPFERIAIADADEGKLLYYLQKHRIGQYTRIEKAFRAAIKLDLNKLSVEALEGIPGIGPKTARMIVLYYDPKADCVPLDTHILKWLRFKGVKNVPKSTPQAGPTYKRLETAFQAFAKAKRMSVRDLDTQVWKTYAKVA